MVYQRVLAVLLAEIFLGSVRLALAVRPGAEPGTPPGLAASSLGALEQRLSNDTVAEASQEPIKVSSEFTTDTTQETEASKKDGQETVHTEGTGEGDELANTGSETLEASKKDVQETIHTEGTVEGDELANTGGETLEASKKDVQEAAHTEGTDVAETLEASKQDVQEAAHTEGTDVAETLEASKKDVQEAAHTEGTDVAETLEASTQGVQEGVHTQETGVDDAVAKANKEAQTLETPAKVVPEVVSLEGSTKGSTITGEGEVEEDTASTKNVAVEPEVVSTEGTPESQAVTTNQESEPPKVLYECEGGWQKGEIKDGVEKVVGDHSAAASKEQCMDMISKSEPEANGALWGSEEKTCFAKIGMIDVKPSEDTAFFACKFKTKATEKKTDPIHINIAVDGAKTVDIKRIDKNEGKNGPITLAVTAGSAQDQDV